jgi:glycine betaine/proline transport system substrate-binding protein
MSGLLVACALLIAGCGGSSSDAPSAERPAMHFVYVNWVEGIAITHLLHEVLEDSLGVDVEMSRVNGGGVAFSSVATGDADIFVEAWLPTTHKGPWNEYQDRLHKLGYTYRGTSVGLVVPDYAPIEHIRDLPEHRAALDGTIHGIEAGAAINDQTRQILENNGIEDFRVVASSEPAMIAALRRAISQEEPFVLTGWKPHWMWGQFDLRYLEGAQTSQTPVFGEPEDIYTIVRTGFEADFPAPVVRFLEQFEIDDAQLNSLMQDFRPESEKDPLEAARDWIRAHPEAVQAWLEAAEAAPSAE